MRIKLRHIVLVVVAIFGLLIVYNIWRALRPPEAVTFADLCQHHDTDVWVEGYLMLGTETTCHVNLDGFVPTFCEVGFHSSQDSLHEEATVYVPETDAPNTDKRPNTVDPIPGEYTQDDLHIHTDDGQTLTYRDKVKVLGNVYGYGNGACQLTANKILKADR